MTPAPSLQVFYVPQASTAAAVQMIPSACNLAMNPPAYDVETNDTRAYGAETTLPTYDAVDMNPPAYDTQYPPGVEKRRLSVAVPAAVGGPSTPVAAEDMDVDSSITAGSSPAAVGAEAGPASAKQT